MIRASSGDVETQEGLTGGPGGEWESAGIIEVVWHDSYSVGKRAQCWQIWFWIETQTFPKKKEAKHFEIQTSFGSRVWNLCWEGYCWPTCSRIWKFLEILPKPRVFLCWHLLPTCMEDLLQPLLMIFYQPYHWESWNHRVYITVWPADTMLPRSASCIFF